MKQYKIPKKTRSLWQIRIGIAGCILLTILIILSFIYVWFLISVVIFALLLALFLFWFLPRYFSSYEILFPNSAIIIKRGVFIKTSHIMPFSRLVYTESYSTPLSRVMGLSALSLKAARSRIIIPELFREDVIGIIDNLKKENED